MLIANRGEIAVRIIQTLKRMNIASVVIYHATDVDSIAVQQADEVLEIFGETPVAAYINQDSIISACLRSGGAVIAGNISS